MKMEVESHFCWSCRSKGRPELVVNKMKDFALIYKYNKGQFLIIFQFECLWLSSAYLILMYKVLTLSYIFGVYIPVHDNDNNGNDEFFLMDQIPFILQHPTWVIKLICNLETYCIGWDFFFCVISRTTKVKVSVSIQMAKLITHTCAVPIP